MQQEHLVALVETELLVQLWQDQVDQVELFKMVVVDLVFKIQVVVSMVSMHQTPLLQLQL